MRNRFVPLENPSALSLFEKK